jgi:predicted outer membrane protein
MKASQDLKFRIECSTLLMMRCKSMLQAIDGEGFDKAVREVSIDQQSDRLGSARHLH